MGLTILTFADEKFSYSSAMMVYLENLVHLFIIFYIYLYLVHLFSNFSIFREFTYCICHKIIVLRWLGAENGTLSDCHYSSCPIDDRQEYQMYELDLYECR